MILDLQRAAVIAALLFSTNSFSQTKSTKSETFQDIIAKAQNLALQKDRQQALTILLNAINKESPKSLASVELKRSLNELSAVFFNDKTQQLYEVAVTLKRTDLAQALQKISEAQRLEPDNLVLSLEQARNLIAKSDCSAAEEILVKARLQNPYYEEINLAYAQGAFCLGKAVLPLKSVESIDMKKSALAKFWLILDVEKHIKEKNLSKATDVLLSIKKIDPHFPEIDYWFWKIDQLNKKKGSAFAEKYLMACKNISAHVYRQYMMDPLLCRRTSEMENPANE